MQTRELRPLGAGELLDRAVTLFVRQFVPIVIVLALAIAPLIVFEAIVSPRSARVYSDMARVFAAAGDTTAQREAAKAMSADSSASGALILLFVVGIFVRLLMWSAIVALIAGAYTGTRTTIAQAYRIGVQRWLPQLVVGLAFTVMGLVAGIPVIVLYVLVALLVVAMAALQQIVATVIVGVVGGLLFLTALAVIGSFVFMAYELASVAVVTETANPFDAIGLAMRRTFARGMRRRTVVAGLVVALVTYGGTLPLLVIAALAAGLTHIDALYFAIFGAGSVLLEGLIAAFIVVYSVDVRVRREGWDIIAAETPPALA